MGLFGPNPTKLEKGLAAFRRQDWRRARRLLEQADIEHPSATGDYHLGLLEWRGLGGPRDVRAAVDCFARASEAGHPAAQTAYGIALRAGIGAARDNDAAQELFRLAASAGDADGMVQLALMSDTDDARSYLVRASELGNPSAMLHLSNMLMRDEPVEALAWLYASVTISGDDACRKRAAALAREMSAKEIEAAQKAGRIYARDILNRSRARVRA
ncbi:MAG: sel1 repeat family protein [Proteobacteria bacterium]|nr:sel1 repeat family protein [Pseudomonadota bacterium]